METPSLSNPNEFPSEEILEKVLGSSYDAFRELMATITGAELSLTAEWRYYKDGKAWLCKVCQGKKTIFWLSVWDNCFKTGFYFTEKTRIGIMMLDIDERIKADFSQSKPIGKLIPLTIIVEGKEPLLDLIAIAKYKVNLK